MHSLYRFHTLKQYFKSEGKCFIGFPNMRKTNKSTICRLLLVSSVKAIELVKSEKLDLRCMTLKSLKCQSNFD